MNDSDNTSTPSPSPDRILLERAASAAGYTVIKRLQRLRDADGFGSAGLYLKGGTTCWNSLTDYGCALRLAVDLQLDIHFHKDLAEVWVRGPLTKAVEPYGENRYQAACRAITRAAAAQAAYTCGASPSR